MLDIRYVAGLFDGEGCISLIKANRKNSSLHSYSVRVVIAMTNKPIIKLLHSQFGGIYTERNGNDTSTRNSFSLLWSNNKAKPILEQLLPHLILKRSEAEIALNFINELSQVGTSFWRKATQNQISELQNKRENVRKLLAQMKRVNYSTKWNDGELGETPMPGLAIVAEGQPLAKQRLAAVGVCND